MTLILELLPEEEAALRQQARQEGCPAEAVAHALVRGGLHLPDADPKITLEKLARLHQRLLSLGLMTTLPTGPLGPPPPPITVLGPPVSQTLVEDRE